MSRLLLVLLVLAAARLAPAARRPPRVADTLCISWSAGPLLGLTPAAQDNYLGALAGAGWRWLRTAFTARRPTSAGRARCASPSA